MQEQWRVDHEHEAHEHPFDPLDAQPDEVAAYLKRWGLDFTDNSGHPLRCTKILSRQALAAAKGMMSRMPDPDQFQEVGLATSLQSQVEEWQRSRRKR